MSDREIVVRNALGVCSVEEDTRLLAWLSAEIAPAGGRVLDLGAGAGYVAIYLAQRGFTVDATDISERALALAGENVERNGVSVNLLHSDLFSNVRGPYDLIAFNPPMNPDETEWTRLVTSFLRRRRTLANILMKVFDRFLDNSRIDFLLDFLTQAQEHLSPDGYLVLELTRIEIEELITRRPDLEFGRRVDIPRLPTEQLVVVTARRGNQGE
jgi:methylase of polypeptide subunit release factors